jgi:transposase
LAPQNSMGAGMIGEMMYHTILTLWKSGKSQRDIASDLSLSKTTVNRYCRMTLRGEAIHSCRRAGRSEFAVAEDFIRERLLSKPRLRASRLYLEVKQRYPDIRSKQRAFRSFVKTMKDQLPKQPRRYFSIVETAPGKQVQVDMGEMRIDHHLTGQIKVYFAGFILSCSRYIFVHWQLHPYRTADFIEAHRQAFSYFEGVPEECVYDQTKLVVIQEKYREVILNQEFHQFASKVGFHPHVCEGYDPQSKGKVERIIEEVKSGFLYGRTFSDLQDIQAKGYQWLALFNGRRHATTHLIPTEAWQSEKSLLKPLPDTLIRPLFRKADKTGLISYAGNKYSVPQVYQEKDVIVEEAEGIINIIDIISYGTIASHTIPVDKGRIIKSSNHYRDYSLEYQVLLAQMLDLMKIYPLGDDIVRRVVADNPKIPRDQLKALRKLFNHYDQQTWMAALPLIDKQEQLRATLIERILDATQRNIRLSRATANSIHTQACGSAIQRPLNDYMRVVNNDRTH